MRSFKTFTDSLLLLSTKFIINIFIRVHQPVVLNSLYQRFCMFVQLKLGTVITSLSTSQTILLVWLIQYICCLWCGVISIYYDTCCTTDNHKNLAVSHRHKLNLSSWFSHKIIGKKTLSMGKGARVLHMQKSTKKLIFSWTFSVLKL